MLQFTWIYLFERDFSKSWRLNSVLLSNDNFTSHFTAKFNTFYEVSASSSPSPAILWETCKVFSRGIIYLTQPAGGVEGLRNINN